MPKSASVCRIKIENMIENTDWKYECQEAQSYQDQLKEA